MSRKRKQYQIKQLTVDEEYIIYISESQLTELIQILQGREYNPKEINTVPELVFVKADNKEDTMKELTTVLENGLIIDDIKYVRLGKSASMGRNGVTALINEDIAERIKELISLGKDKEITDAVISKLESYLGLCFSTCLFVNEVPENICIVPEYEITINDYIKSYDLEANDVIEGKYDVKGIVLHDGMGLHSPEYGKRLGKALGLTDTPVGYQVRLLPFCKGLSLEFDFKAFYKERGIKTIKDRWGKEWDIDDLDAIWSESLFKGKDWFKSYDEFVALRKKYYQPLGLYNIGIAKYSEPSDKANKMTRMTYQYLQNLALSGGDLIDIANYTKDIIEKVYKGDSIYTQIYLGLLANEQHDNDEKLEDEIQDKIMAGVIYNAVMSNPDMMVKDPYVKSFLKRQLKKTIDEMKLGRVYVNGRYSFICQDPILFLEYAAGLEPLGCLNKNEFYSAGVEGIRATFRSPLIHSSEIGKLNFIANDLTDKWLNRYDNIIVLNCYDLTAQKHGGADFDGDTFFWTDDKRIIDSVIEEFEYYNPDTKEVELKRNYPVVDINEGKAKPLKVPVTKENILEYDLKTLDNQIGAITNYATYWTTKGSAKGNANRYDKHLVYLRIAQGMEIDYIKTGFRLEIDETVAKKFKPYFLQKYKYKKSYGIMGEYADTASLNILCNHIERWEKKTFIWDKWEKQDVIDTADYLINKDLMKANPTESNRIKKELQVLHQEFGQRLSILSRKLGDPEEIDKQFEVFFDKYRVKVNQISDNKELLSSIAVYITYKESKRDNKTKSYVFPWCNCWEGLVATLDKKQSSIKRLPERILKADEIEEFEMVFEMFGKQYRERFAEVNVDSSKFIIHKYEQQIEKELKKAKESFQYELPLVGVATTGQEVAERLKQDGNVTLDKRQYTRNGQLLESIGIFQNGDYLASISPKYSETWTDEFIDFKDYIGKDAQVEVLEAANKSLEVNLSLVN